MLIICHISNYESILYSDHFGDDFILYCLLISLKFNNYKLEIS